MTVDVRFLNLRKPRPTKDEMDEEHLWLVFRYHKKYKLAYHGVAEQFATRPAQSWYRRIHDLSLRPDVEEFFTSPPAPATGYASAT